MSSSAPPQPPGTLVADSPAQLLALVPFHLGFRPADSLVLLEVRTPRPGSTRERLGVVVRVDLPPTEHDTDVAPAAGRAVRALLDRAASDARVLVLGYDPEATRTGVLVPGARAVATLTAVSRLLEARGRDVVDVVVLTDHRFRSLTCDLACCPREGTPLATTDVDRVSAEAVGLGLGVAADREAVLPPTTPVEVGRRSVASAARREATRPWTPDRRRALLAEWDAELDRRAEGATTALPAPESCGRLLAGFDDPATRDAVLLGGARGPRTDRARAALVAGPDPSASDSSASDSSASGDDVTALVALALREESDARRSALAAALAVDVARHASGPAAAGAWAVAAWSSWNGGNGVRAGAAAEEALRLDPAQRLARLVLQLVLAGRPPCGD